MTCRGRRTSSRTIHRRPDADDRSAATARGFTLLELLVVVGVVSVLLGLSLGFLGRTDPERIAASVLAGETRAAQLTARAEGVATEVWVRPGQDGAPGTVQARLLRPAAAFHFEPGEDVLHESMRPVLSGEDVPQGRFGHARRHAEGGRGPLLRWLLAPAQVDLAEGFVVRLDLRLERAAAATVLRIGQAVELLLDDQVRPRARLRLRGPGGATALAAVAGEMSLPLRRWCTLELGCDRGQAWITLDGRELARAVAEGSMPDEADAALEVSLAEAPVPGTVDEVRMAVFTFSPAQSLPSGLQPERAYRIAFDARGEPSARPEVRWVQDGGAP
jgi:prepilin-type N-terminal cleavage/methylation domain-containing protein